MSWKDLVWTRCDPPIDDSAVREIESTLGKRFPEEFVECIKQCHGGTPSRNSFRFEDGKGEMGSCLAFLLSFLPGKDEGILDCIDLLEDQLPSGLVPFGEDAGGDCICFDYNNLGENGSPQIVYWHHEKPVHESVTFLTTDFVSFISMLE